MSGCRWELWHWRDSARSSRRNTAGPFTRACRKNLEAANGSSFVFVDIEHGVQLCNLQQILHALVQAEQLQLPAAIGHGREARHQLADPRAVNVGDLAQVEQDLLLVFADHITQGVS